MAHIANILAIDDSELALLGFVGALKGTDYAVYSARSGPEALELARGMKFDLVFLDLKMPVMDGVATLRALRPLIGDVPVYIVTAYSDEFMKRLYEAANTGLAFEVAEKPLDGNEILAIVHGIFHGPRGF